MRSLLVFSVVALAVLVLAVFSAMALGSICAGGAGGASVVPISYQAPAMAVDDAVFRPQLIQARPDQTGWRRHFLCEVKASDIALAAFALLLILAMLFQGSSMTQGMKAAERSSHVVNYTLVASQRAYVVFKEFRVSLVRTPPTDEITTVTVQPVWENSGTTPTRAGRAHVNWKYFERAIPSDFDFGDFDDVGNRILSFDAYSPLVLGPRATSFSSVISIDAATLRHVRELQGRLLIWGWVEYDDIFNTGRHRTEFAYQMLVSANVITPTISFTQYHRFNAVDEDCERAPSVMAQS